MRGRTARERQHSIPHTFNERGCRWSTRVCWRRNSELIPMPRPEWRAPFAANSSITAEALRSRWPFPTRRGELAFLIKAAEAGYNTILCFYRDFEPGGIRPTSGNARSQGGHDVPANKMEARFPRVLANLKTALLELPKTLRTPYRLIAVAQQGRVVKLQKPIPRWLSPILPKI